MKLKEIIMNCIKHHASYNSANTPLKRLKKETGVHWEVGFDKFLSNVVPV